MHGHQAARDGEPEAGASAAGGQIADLAILLEYRRALRGRDAWPGVDGAHRDVVTLALHRDPHAAAVRELDGVAHDVAEDLAHPPTVGVGDEPRLAGELQCELFGAGDGLGLTHDFLGYPVEVDRSAGETQPARF